MATTAIGIDLGTTNCCVAVWQGDVVEVISNEVGRRITPSYVAFTEDDRLVGDPARNQAHKNPENTLYAVKRLIGRSFSDKTVQDDISQWDFAVEAGPGDAPRICVKHDGTTKRLAPEEVSAMLLAQMKDDAEAFLDETVTQAVVTVPGYFTEAQRVATKAAGEIAGLDIIRILNEPTAGALAYGCDRTRHVRSKVMIYDLGGGTCDVSIQEIISGDFRVVAIQGDTHLGGEDIDNRLVEHFLAVRRASATRELLHAARAHVDAK